MIAASRNLAHAARRVLRQRVRAALQRKSVASYLTTSVSSTPSGWPERRRQPKSALISFSPYSSRSLSTSVTKTSINQGYEGNGVLGIVRESYNKWERRVPLTPDQVRDLITKGFKVIVQPANHRIFTDSEYATVGATLQEDLSEACLIVGVKQVRKGDASFEGQQEMNCTTTLT